jgi:large subunit ribosomal protein L20
MSLKRDKVFELSKGFVGRAKNCYRVAKPKVIKALQYAYRDRRVKKRTLRQTFISQVNAGTRLHGLAYSEFVHGLVRADIHLDRKVLADLAVNEPFSFQALVRTVQSTIPTRNTDAKRTQAVPQKVQFMPVSWETFKEQVVLHDALNDAMQTHDLRAEMDRFVAPAIAKARQANVKDLQEGKYKIIQPTFRMSKEERAEYAAQLQAQKERIARIKEAAKA